MKKILSLILCFMLLASPLSAGIDFVTDDYLNCGTPTDGMLYNQALTVSAWVFIEGAGANNAGTIISRANQFYTLGSSILITYFSDSETYVQFEVKGATNLYRLSTGSASDGNVWQNLIVTWDGSTTAANSHIYINGAEVGYQTTTNGATLTDNSAQPLIIGNIGILNGAFLNGKIDEVYVWKAELTASEIFQASKSRGKRIGLQIQPTNLVSAYFLDEQPDGTSADGDTFRDYGTNASNCTGVDGANNTGLTMEAERILSYP